MIYLDHAATTPLDPAVLDAMLPYLREDYGNASSVHQLGRRARVAIERAREQVAAHLRCEPSEVIFTSGATEANNAALRGVLAAVPERPGLVTSAAEHEAILQPAEALREAGHPVTVLAPSGTGAVTSEHVANVLDALSSAETPAGLVSVMLVNNELGTVSPVADIAQAARERGAYMHTDAVQAATLFDLDVDTLGIDLLSLSGHKMYGPKGVGVLYVRSGTPIVPMVLGGAQERRRRGGTENVAAVVGLAAALDLAVARRAEERTRLMQLQQRLARRLAEAFGDVVCFNTPLQPYANHVAEVAPHILNVSVGPSNGVSLDGEMLLLNLDLAGVLVSSGSACASGAVEPSHVLRALQVPAATANATVRFSLGRATTEADIDTAFERVHAAVSRMCGAISGPLGEG
ncbi:MAG: cysteine desulfurase family protein [Bacteroidota bacterium]